MSRIKRLIERRPSAASRYVLYWMQASARVPFNLALKEASTIANAAHLPLLVLFVLDPTYPGANLRHFWFLLEGLEETVVFLKRRGIPFVLRTGNPNVVLNELAPSAHTIVIDVGYTRIQREWRKTLYLDLEKSHPDTSLVSVEDNVLVPVREAMDKAAYGAYVLRPKIHRVKHDWFPVDSEWTYDGPDASLEPSDRDLAAWRTWISDLPLDQSVAPSPVVHGGRTEAIRKLKGFLKDKLPRYLESADPSSDLTSGLSPYLHFGQLGVLEILAELEQVRPVVPNDAWEAFFEQLIVRRELAVNFVFYKEGYDRFEEMTEPWAYQTMRRHDADARETLYSEDQLERSLTHDPYWNACMTEMRLFGTMPNYLRMYWAKKVIEWSPDHQTAYRRLLSFNDKYFLDGRDPNGYAGIAWCFGRHDRPWTERNIFGTLRYMNAAGLKRKFDIDRYVRMVLERCVSMDETTSMTYDKEKE